MSSSDPEQGQMRDLASATYKQYSFLPDVVTLVDFDAKRAPTRYKFAQKVVLDHWGDPSYVHDIVFHDLGRIISLSERKFVVDEMLGRIPASGVEQISFAAVQQAATSLVEEGHEPSALLLPIDLYQRVFSEWDPSGRLHGYHPETLTVLGEPLKLYWSNKFVPFGKAYVVCRDFAAWTAKPNKQDRLSVSFTPTGDGSMEVLVEARFDYRVIDASLAKALSLRVPG